MKWKMGFYILLCVALMASLSGCAADSGAAGHTTNQQTGVEAALQAGMARADNTRQNGLTENAQEPETRADESTVLSTTDGIDVDLTVLSSTMVYSQVFQMMCGPEDFIGKTIKMEGALSVYHDERSGKNYYACVIQDATACCSQGIEFVLTDDYSYPEDYPEPGESITVTGVFDTYTEGEQKYCTLREATLG